MTGRTDWQLRIRTGVYSDLRTLPCDRTLAGVKVSRAVGADGSSVSSTARLTWLTDQVTDPDPLFPAIGDLVVIDMVAAADLPVAARNRFHGTVTDVQVSVADQLINVVAVGLSAMFRRAYIGSAPWAEQTDFDRWVTMAYALDAVSPWPAAYFPTPYGDPGAYVVTRDVDRQSFMGLADELAQSTGGAVVERRNGIVAYLTRDAASEGGPDASTRNRVELDACDLVDVEYVVLLADVANDVTVVYGYAPLEGGDRPSVTQVDASSFAYYGEFNTSLTSQLRDLADATARADEILLVRGFPGPYADAAVLPIKVIDADAVVLDILSMETLDPVTLANVGYPLTGDFRGRVLTWDETWPTKYVNDMVASFTLSPAGLFDHPTTWDDLEPCGATWDDLATDLTTWDGAAFFDPCDVLH